MPKNIEIKAKVDNLQSLLGKALALSGTRAKLIKQKDVFFNCKNGRLKLRFFSANRGELIHYIRSDSEGPKSSRYHITKTKQPARLRKTLAAAYGESMIVRKVRTLVIVGRTRIHLDDVKNLGTFVELEVVMDKGETEISAENEAFTLMAQLGIHNEQLVAGAYADLLEQTR